MRGDKFKIGELVWALPNGIGAMQAGLWGRDRILAIISDKSNKKRFVSRKYLIHMPSGDEHWYWPEELERATNDNTIL